MKRIAFLIVVLLGVSIGASAQSEVDKDVLALPAALRDGATVIKWKPDYTYETLRKGTNKMVCYDRSGFPTQQPFSLECTDQRNLDRVKQNLEAEALGDKKGAIADLRKALELEPGLPSAISALTRLGAAP